MGSWDDLRFFLEIARAGSLSAAGRSLGVNHSTVGRRLDALEADLGARLFRRSSSGFTLTSAGTTLLQDVEAVETAVRTGHRRVRGSDTRLQGVLRLATTEVLGRTFVSPVLEQLQRDHPELDVVLLASNAFVDLERGDADLAVRIAPTSTPSLVTKHFGEISFGLYASERYLAQRGVPSPTQGLAGHTVLAYTGVLGASEQGAWLEEQLEGARVSVRSDSIGVLFDAAGAGRGVTLLPDPLAESDSRLRRLVWSEPAPVRGTWFVFHPDQRNNARLRAAMEAMIARAGQWVLNHATP